MENVTKKEYTVAELLEAIEQHKKLFEQLAEAESNGDYEEYVKHVEYNIGFRTPADYDEWVEIAEDQREAFNVFVENGLGTTYDQFEQSYQGGFDTAADFVKSLIEEEIFDKKQIKEIARGGAEAYWESTLRHSYSFIDGYMFRDI